jgi:mycothiol synthase
MLEKYFLRRPGKKDQQAVLDLMIRCDIRDVGQPDSDLSDLQYDWRKIDLDRDAWLAFDRKGVLKGYAAVLPWQTGQRLVIYDDPGTEGDDLFLGLLLLCEGWAAARLRDNAEPGRKQIVTHISDSVDYQKKNLANVGYTINRFIFNMQMDLSGEVSLPAWPDGVVVRTARTGVDDKLIHAIVQKAFRKSDHPDQPFDEWKEFMMRADLYDADLWFLALDGDEIVGTCLCFPYEETGWIRQLAVADAYRKRGLGSALLLHSFHTFKQRGYQKVGLAVESANLNAYRLYERVGMKKTIQLDEYMKAASK